MPVVVIDSTLLRSGLVCPIGKDREELCDKQTPGLYLEVRAKSQGTATYYLRYKNEAGKTCHQKIGRTCEITLVDARRKALELKAEIAKGRDPRAEQKAHRECPTLDDFFEQQYKPYSKARKRSWARDEQLYRLRIKKDFGDKKLNRITRQDVSVFHTALISDGLAPASCDHHAKLVRRMLNLAVEWGYLEKNPVSGIKLLNPDNKLENYLDPEQLERLVHVLRTDKARTVCNIALFLLSTGARLNEALTAKWEYVSLDKRIWRIPATTSKSKKIRTVPLNSSAIELLESLGTRGKHEYLFVSEITKKPITAVHKVWERLREEAGMPNLRIHDLRHTFASLLANSGRSLYEIQHILGHSDPMVTQRYAHLSQGSLQDAANCAGALIGKITQAA